MTELASLGGHRLLKHLPVIGTRVNKDRVQITTTKTSLSKLEGNNKQIQVLQPTQNDTTTEKTSFSSQTW